MKVSVVTISFNAVKEIEKTIQSVINQTYNNIEYIIIDGASTDGTLNIIKKYEARISLWKSEPDQGIYDAMNKGIKLATGDWINFMNAGDIFTSNNVVANFVAKIAPSTTIAYGDTNFLLSSSVIVWKAYPLSYMKDMMCFGHQSVFVRLQYHKEHLFDTSFRSSADYKLMYDAYFKDNVSFQYIPIIVADFDAVGGVSANSYCLRLKEDARIQGIDQSLKWKIKYIYSTMVYYMKRIVKKLIPQHVLDARTKRIMDSRQ